MFDLFDQPRPIEKKYNRRILPQKKTWELLEFNARIGAMRLALEALGGSKTCLAIEPDRFAQLTYTANFEDKPLPSLPEKLPHFDLLTAMISSQEETQIIDFQSVIKILTHSSNVAFLLETHPKIAQQDGGQRLRTWNTTLQNLNFDLFSTVLDASRFGVAQIRKRFFIVGFRCDYFKKRPDFHFPQGSSKKVYLNQILETNVSGYAVSEHFQAFHLFRSEGAQVVETNAKALAKPLSAAYHKIQPLVGTFVKDDETGVRLLSENECKALMGFDRNFIFPVSRTQMYRQLGGSAVVPMIAAIGEAIFKVLPVS